MVINETVENIVARDEVRVDNDAYLYSLARYIVISEYISLTIIVWSGHSNLQFNETQASKTD